MTYLRGETRRGKAGPASGLSGALRRHALLLAYVGVVVLAAVLVGAAP